MSRIPEAVFIAVVADEDNVQGLNGQTYPRQAPPKVLNVFPNSIEGLRGAINLTDKVTWGGRTPKIARITGCERIDLLTPRLTFESLNNTDGYYFVSARLGDELPESTPWIRRTTFVGVGSD